MQLENINNYNSHQPFEHQNTALMRPKYLTRSRNGVTFVIGSIFAVGPFFQVIVIVQQIWDDTNYDGDSKQAEVMMTFHSVSIWQNVFYSI